MPLKLWSVHSNAKVWRKVYKYVKPPIKIVVFNERSNKICCQAHHLLIIKYKVTLDDSRQMKSIFKFITEITHLLILLRSWSKTLCKWCETSKTASSSTERPAYALQTKHVLSNGFISKILKEILCVKIQLSKNATKDNVDAFDHQVRYGQFPTPELQVVAICLIQCSIPKVEIYYSRFCKSWLSDYEEDQIFHERMKK